MSESSKCHTSLFRPKFCGKIFINLFNLLGIFIKVKSGQQVNGINDLQSLGGLTSTLYPAALVGFNIVFFSKFIYQIIN